MSTDKNEFSPEETARRRDAVLKIMVNTPPQPRVTPPQKAGSRKKAGPGPKARPKAGRGKPGSAS